MYVSTVFHCLFWLDIMISEHYRCLLYTVLWIIPVYHWATRTKHNTAILFKKLSYILLTQYAAVSRIKPIGVRTPVTNVVVTWTQNLDDFCSCLWRRWRCGTSSCWWPTHVVSSTLSSLSSPCSSGTTAASGPHILTGPSWPCEPGLPFRIVIIKKMCENFVQSIEFSYIVFLCFNKLIIIFYFYSE